MSRECAYCRSLFTPPRKRHGQRFCSRLCQRRAHCLGNAELSRRTASKRGDTLRAKGGTGYAKREGRHEHRRVAERSLGRPLAPNEIVHHRDGDRRNNAPENLEVMTQAEHARLHSTKHRTCETPGCERKHKAGGLCGMHYQRKLKRRTP